MKRNRNISFFSTFFFFFFSYYIFGDYMRIFYAFKIKKEFYDIYMDTPSVLYNFLNQLYNFRRDDLDYGNNLFQQIANMFDKEELDKRLFLKLHNKMKYCKRGDEHIINNLYKNEVSIMKIKKSYIVINSNKSCTEFFDFLVEEDDCIFVCDFINHDYFYANKVKMLV